MENWLNQVNFIKKYLFEIYIFVKLETSASSNVVGGYTICHFK